MNRDQVRLERETRFKFGRNWARFLRTFNETRLQVAKESLTAMLEMENLDGLTFLDIGCGSGIFSLSAMQLGASRVHSFDYDADSVECARELKRRFFAESSDWTIEQGDVLNEEYVRSLGDFDIVYSWGVLHHTGDMWKALEHAARPVRDPGGRLFVAIYQDTGRSARYWLKVKRVYCRLPAPLRVPYTLLFLLQLEGRTMVGNILRGKSPLHHWKEYYKSRGMSRWYDIVDWVGGYPYEFAKPDLIFDFYRARGFRLDRLSVPYGNGNNQFVFTRL